MSTLLDYPGFLQIHHAISGHQISQTKATFEHFFVLYGLVIYTEKDY